MPKRQKNPGVVSTLRSDLAFARNMQQTHSKRAEEYFFRLQKEVPQARRDGASRGNILGREIAAIDVFLERARECDERPLEITSVELLFLVPLAKAQRAKLNDELLVEICGSDAQKVQDPR